MTSRVGFTLIELLVTILVIVIMAGFLITALSGVRETARQMRTQQFIMRLHTQLMPRYQAFRSRPLPVNPFDSITPVAAANVNNTSGTQERAQIAWFKLWGMRALMAMELPDSFGDLMLQTPWLQNTASGKQGVGATVPYVPSLTSMYIDHVYYSHKNPTFYDKDAFKPSTTDGLKAMLTVAQSNIQNNMAAECLYMIIEASVTDRDLYNVCFNDTDVGDTNGNGLPEFLDAWGNPISFVRWPAGFVSDLQPMYRYNATSVIPGASTVTYQAVYGANHPRDLVEKRNGRDVILSRFPVNGTSDERLIGIAGGFHDAFDPYYIDRWEPSTGNTGVFAPDGSIIKGNTPACDCFNPPVWGVSSQGKDFGLPERSFNLTPLIVSAGSDGDVGLAINSLDVAQDTAAIIFASGTKPYGTAVNPYLVFEEHEGIVKPDGSYGHKGTGRFYQRAAISETAAGSGDNIHNHRATPTTGR